MEKILIQLDEDPTIATEPLGEGNTTLIKSIIDSALEAKQARSKPAKTPDDRLTNMAIAALLESPDGMSAADLLLASDSDNIISLVLKIRNRLKRDNIYTLEKGKRDRKPVYIIKMVSDTCPSPDRASEYPYETESCVDDLPNSGAMGDM